MLLRFVIMMSKEIFTKECSPVIFFDDWVAGRVSFPLEMTARKLDMDFNLEHKPFKANLSKLRHKITELLNSHLRAEEMMIPPSTNQSKRKPRPSWRVTVNSKRVKIEQVLNTSRSTSIKVLAKEAGCDQSTMRAAMKDRELKKTKGLYNYNNQHSPEVDLLLDNLITDPANKYFSIGDLKRSVQTQANCRVSRKWIAKKLKSHGLRYLKLKRERKEGDQRVFNEKQLKQVVWTAAQAWKGDDELMLFMDEAEFLLNVTSDYCWSKPGELPTYNRRETAQRSLHVIAICTLDNFYAVQILNVPYTKECIYFFITEVLKRLNSGKDVIILLDNAGPHVSNFISKSSFKEVLLPNVPYCWEANFIENTFSKLKALWRQRQISQTIEEEIKTLTNLLLDSSSAADFQGYRRQYLRQLLDLVQSRITS